MIYTFFVLMFGVYLGQEYPQIPSVKATVQIFIERLKSDDNDDSNQVHNQRSERIRNMDEQSGSFEMVVVPKRRSGYYSLPIWVSNWWSSQEKSNESGDSRDFEEVHEKTE